MHIPPVKGQRLKVKGNLGFTLIELLVVLSIMGVLFGAILANYSAQRIPRNLKIAQNELVSNIRKTQSYALSSRQLPGGQTPEYYAMEFNTAVPTQYTIKAIYNTANPPAQLVTVETVKFPLGIRIASSNPITIDGTTIASGCALVVFRLPFGKIIAQDGCSLSNTPTIGSIASPDDYFKVTSFISNGVSGTPRSDVSTVIRLTDTNATVPAKIVTISGVTGVVTFQ